MYAFFFDRANPDVSPEFQRVGRNVRTMSLFLLMDEHPMSMREQLDILTAGQGPKVWRCTTVASNTRCGIHYHFVVQLPLPNPVMPHQMY